MVRYRFQFRADRSETRVDNAADSNWFRKHGHQNYSQRRANCPGLVHQIKNKILTVKNGSTLWRLANRVKPDALTIEQVMMALYDENPDAFEYNNVNALEKVKHWPYHRLNVWRKSQPSVLQSVLMRI